MAHCLSVQYIQCEIIFLDAIQKAFVQVKSELHSFICASI